jgi:hypothetical protein
MSLWKWFGFELSRMTDKVDYASPTDFRQSKANIVVQSIATSVAVLPVEKTGN